MGIDPNRVSRVIIAGAWYSCQVGTFRIVPYQFVDASGNRIGEQMGMAYEFYTIDRDFYTGPVSALQLVKLTPE